MDEHPLQAKKEGERINHVSHLSSLYLNITLEQQIQNLIT